MRATLAMICILTMVCFYMPGCEPEKEGPGLTVNNPPAGGGGPVSVAGTGRGAAIRIDGMGGKAVTIRIYNAVNGALLAAKEHAVPPGPYWLFYPKLLPGTYYVDVVLGDMLCGRCQFVVVP